MKAGLYIRLYSGIRILNWKIPASETSLGCFNPHRLKNYQRFRATLASLLALRAQRSHSCYLLPCCSSEDVSFEVRTLCPKRFTFKGVSVRVGTVRWNFLFFFVGGKFLKNNFIWVGEKNTFLKKLPSALASAFFKSVFFLCVGFFSHVNFIRSPFFKSLIIASVAFKRFSS